MSANPPKVTANQVFDRLTAMTVNLMLSRTGLLGQDAVNGLDKGGRDLDDECKYIKGDPTLREYRLMYDQEGVATRIVNVLPSETWSVYPELYETEEVRRTAFERAWDAFAEKHDPWAYLHQVDELSGIGRYGLLVIGLDDNQKLDTPAAGLDARGLRPKDFVHKRPVGVNYLMPYSEDLVSVVQTEGDDRNPRFGMPTMYAVRVTDPTVVTDDEVPTGGVKELRVHWTRALHVAENCKSSRWAGTPRLQNQHRRVFDVRKMLGSSGEMFYKGGFPGISFETFPELTMEADLDLDSVKKDIEAYSAGLQRYIRLIGMTAKSLGPQIADPTNFLMQQYIAICYAIGVPVRVFLGSEVGQLASVQDASTWNRRLSGRQQLYVQPRIIKPFVERLVMLGVLPEPKSLIVNWRDLNALSDKDRADVALKRAQAVLQYITSGSAKVISPKYFFTLVLGLTEREAAAVIDHAGGEEKIMAEVERLRKANAGNTPATSKKNPAARTGAGGKRNGLGGSRKRKNV